MTTMKTGLSEALRAIRREHGWTLADVTARTGIPAPTLSKVENGKLSLTYDKLVSLSQGLGVDITRLFNSGAHRVPSAQPATPLTRRSVDRAGDGHFIRTATYDHTYLATAVLNKHIDPCIAELRVHSIEEFGDWIRHTGEEFAYVLEGQVDFYTEYYAPLRLGPGDSVYFDSSMGHAYIAPGTGVSRILSVCTSGQGEILSAFGIPRDALSGRPRPSEPGAPGQGRSLAAKRGG